MKKKIVSMALCLCMVLTLIPAIAYADDQTVTGWDEVVWGTLTAGTDSVTVGSTSYIYGGDKSSGALDLNVGAPTEKTVYKAGDGYILWNGSDTLTFFNEAAINDITIPSGVTLDLSGKDAGTVKNITNNGTLILPDGKDGTYVSGLKLKGDGIVKSGSNCFLNDGTEMNVKAGDLDLSSAASGGNIDTDGYSWDASSKTLTVGNLVVDGNVILPKANCKVVINGSLSADNIMFANSDPGHDLEISGGTLKSNIDLQGNLTIDKAIVDGEVNNTNVGNLDILILKDSTWNCKNFSWMTDGGIDLQNSTLTVGGQEYGQFWTEKILMDGTSVINMNYEISNYGHLADGLDGIKDYLPTGYEPAHLQDCTTVVISGTQTPASNIVIKKQTPSAPPSSYVPTIQYPEIIIVDNIGGTYELSILGTVLTIAADADYSLVSVTKNGENLGTSTQLKDLKTGDKVIIDFDKNVTPEEAKAASVRSLKLIARSKLVTMKTGKKAIRIKWYEKKNGKLVPVSVDLDGVEIYRSAKRTEGYGAKPIFVTANDRYFNTAITTGKTYFYKVRGFVTIGKTKVYTSYSTLAWRKAR